MVVFKTRKLNKKRKNKTRYFKTKRRHYTLKQFKHKSFRKTKHYYNARQYLGGAGEDEPLYRPPLPPDWQLSDRSFASPSPLLPSQPPPSLSLLPSRPPPSAVPPPSQSRVLPPLQSPFFRSPPPSRPPLPPPPPQQSYFLEQPGMLVTMSIALLLLLVVCICNARAFVEWIGDGVRGIGDSVRGIGDSIGELRRQTIRDRTRIQNAQNPGIQMTNISSRPAPVVLPVASDQNMGDECPICHEQYNDDTNPIPDRTITRLLPCRHTFHHHCIQDWLTFTGERKCPTCKQIAPIQEDNVVLTPAPLEPSVSVGGAKSFLDTIAESLKNVDTKVLTEALKNYFEFLHLTHNDYEDIVKLLQIINEDSNLEKLIIIITRGLGFICTKNNETVESTANKSDKRLAKILGENGESTINAILQNCTSFNDLNLTEKQFESVENIENLLIKTLSSSFSKPNKKQLLKSLQLSRVTLTRILKRNN